MIYHHRVVPCRRPKLRASFVTLGLLLLWYVGHGNGGCCYGLKQIGIEDSNDNRVMIEDHHYHLPAPNDNDHTPMYQQQKHNKANRNKSYELLWLTLSSRNLSHPIINSTRHGTSSNAFQANYNISYDIHINDNNHNSSKQSFYNSTRIFPMHSSINNTNPGTLRNATTTIAINIRRATSSMIVTNATSNSTNNHMITSKTTTHFQQGDRSLQRLNCVYNETQLRSAINNVPPSLSYPTFIDICSSYIKIDGRDTGYWGRQGIYLADNYIQLACNLKKTKGTKCILDAQGLSRHFYAFRTTLIFQDITFINGYSINDYDYPHGGVMLVQEYTTLSMYRCDFINNSGHDGGVIHMENSCTGTIEGYNNKTGNPSVALNNVAQSDGGVIWSDSSTVIMNHYNFINNRAQYKAGGIYTKYGTVTVMGDNITTMNGNNGGDHGGFLYAIQSTVHIENYNIVNHLAWDGGVVFITTNSNLEMIGCNLTSNVAFDKAGALYINDNSNADISLCHWRNNTANVDGGGIYVLYSSLTLTGNYNNRADVVDTIIQENNSGSWGGFINSIASNIVIQNYTIYENHGWEGGVVFAQTNSNIEMIGCHIAYNYANRSGGVIYSDASTINIVDCFITDNTANRNGGIINGISSTIHLKNNTIMNNNGIEYAGALSAYYSYVEITSCYFSNNKGPQGGSVLLMDSTLQMTRDEDDDSLVEGNVANTWGGFLAAQRCTINITNYLFRNNFGGDFGGALYIHDCTTYSKNVIFQYNSAEHGGAIDMFFAVATTISNVVFDNNIAGQGTIRLWNSQVDIHNYTFLSNIHADPCNLYFTQLGLTADDFRDSCINLPTLTSITNRRLHTGNFIAHTQEQSNILNQINPSNRLFSTTNTSRDTQISFHYNARQRMMLSGGSCITSSAGLQQAVSSANPRSSPTSTKISICTSKITLGKRSRRLQYGNSSVLTNVSDGIDISNKNIAFICRRNRNKPMHLCTLDAVGIMRHFYGSNTNVRFQNIRFSNGYHPVAGGALLVQNNSKIKLRNCSFWNNKALSGAGAILVYETKLNITGETNIVKQTKGNGAPIEIHSSNATLHNMTFANNNVSQFGDGVFLIDSTINLLNISFAKNSSTDPLNQVPGANCNLFISADPLNRANDATCLNLS